jgi:hypothetical protein
MDTLVEIIFMQWGAALLTYHWEAVEFYCGHHPNFGDLIYRAFMPVHQLSMHQVLTELLLTFNHKDKGWTESMTISERTWDARRGCWDYDVYVEENADIYKTIVYTGHEGWYVHDTDDGREVPFSMDRAGIYSNCLELVQHDLLV